jgi:hypothetical protein
MADLTGQTPASTYKGLLQVNDYTDGIAGNTGSSALVIQDGAGNATALAISTDKVGIGTTSPSDLLELSSGDDTVLNITAANNKSSAIHFSDPDAQNQGIITYTHISDSLRFFTQNTEKMRITSAGNVGIGTEFFGATAAGVLAIKNGTAPTSSPADMVQLYAEDVTASSELRVRDEAGNVTTLSPHAKDAPDSLYDQGKGADEMHRVANHYLGTITFTNVDRRNDLLQKQLNGEELPVDRTFKVTETFAEYNARTGAELQVEDWDANQQAMFDADESYVKKPKPAWLS